jgi:hypothetical protein
MMSSQYSIVMSPFVSQPKPHPGPEANQPGRHEQAKSYVGHQQTNQIETQPAHQHSLKGGRVLL